jgi:hypothetical protein
MSRMRTGLVGWLVASAAALQCLATDAAGLSAVQRDERRRH